MKLSIYFLATMMTSSSTAFSSFGATFVNTKDTSTFSSTHKTNLKMGLFENIPTIMNSDMSTTFGTLSHLALDVGTAAINPEQTACVRLLESVGQVFGLLSYCSSNQCVQSDEVIYQATKIMFSFIVLMKTTIPSMRAALHSVIKPEICPLSSRDRHAYEDLFEPIGLSWLDYNTLKYNGAFEWITMQPNERIMLSDSIQNTSTSRTKLKDLTQRALEKEIYWLHEGSTNDENNGSNLVFASNILRSASKHDSIERSITAGENGATTLKVNNYKISKLSENDAKLDSCTQSLIFMGACHELNEPSMNLA